MGGSLVDNNLPTGANTTTYLYDLVGNLASVTEPNGVVTRYSYHSLNRLIGETVSESSGTSVASYSYTLDNAGVVAQRIVGLLILMVTDVWMIVVVAVAAGDFVGAAELADNISVQDFWQQAVPRLLASNIATGDFSGSVLVAFADRIVDFLDGLALLGLQ